MTERDFLYWLNGYLEFSKTKTMTEEQVTEIRNHIALVMNKVTPELPKKEDGLKTLNGLRKEVDTTRYCECKKTTAVLTDPLFPIITC